MASIFRTPQQEASYEAYKAAGNLDKGCGLCEKESLADFENWRIIENIFPYDRVAKAHHMIVPRRHVTEASLTPAELLEFKEIKARRFNEDYDFIIEATEKRKSIPAHFHVHLIVAKDHIGI